METSVHDVQAVTVESVDFYPGCEELADFWAVSVLVEAKPDRLRLKLFFTSEPVGLKSGDVIFNVKPIDVCAEGDI